MILIADQKRSMADMFARRLRWEGFATEVAADATDALRKIAELPICLAILDPAMPGSGLQVLNRVRANPATASLPIVLFGASDLPQDRQAAQQAGASAYLVKGRVAPNELVEQIRRLLPTARPAATVVTTTSLPTKTAAQAAAVAAQAATYMLSINPEVGDARKLAAQLGYSPTMRCDKCGGSMMLKVGINAQKGPWMFGGLTCQRCVTHSAMAAIGKMQPVAEVHL